ncbi:MAG: hypothetical protein J0H30_07390, partial [Alphaproteobacteria bacterium]|nr:hypothetical protein [Alphaproteobacteria bacterium]
GKGGEIPVQPVDLDVRLLVDRGLEEGAGVEPHQAAVAGFGRDMLGSYQAAFTTMLVVVPFSLLALLLLKPRRTGPAQALAAG